MIRTWTLFWCIVVVLLVSVLSGCATLREVGREPEAFIEEAQPGIEAANVLIDDLVKNPLDEMISLGLGYGLCLLRRWYKKKQGSKG